MSFVSHVLAGQEVTSDELEEILDKDKETQAFTATVSSTDENAQVNMLKLGVVDGNGRSWSLVCCLITD